MAQKLGEAMSKPPLKQAEVAVACGVTKQAVQGWLKTGRFDKKHLPTLAKVTGRPLAWWLDADTDTPSDDLLNALQDWRLQASSKSQEVIDSLILLAKKNKLRDEDWQAIDTMVLRFMDR